MGKGKYLCLHDTPVFFGIDMVSFRLFCHAMRKYLKKKGEYLFRQGDPADTIYFLKDGSFKLVSVTQQGEEMITQIVGPGEVIGEAALFKEDIVLANSAIALEEAKICCLDRQAFENVIESHPELAIQIIRNLGKRLHDTWERFAEFSTQTTQEKIVSLFIRLAREYGQSCNEGTLIKLYLTQQEIAASIGASRVMVSRVLQQLIESDYICKNQGYYVLKRKCVVDL
ncbi:Crp/Fnr family transcriptional regulator [Sporomusa acidovorans]|nr:Crp/Fnr family transcriptional regulator [Sporomusa acidovorans]